MLRARRVDHAAETAAADKLADDRADYGQPGGDSQARKNLRQSEWDFQHPERLPPGRRIEFEKVYQRRLRGFQPEQRARNDWKNRDDGGGSNDRRPSETEPNHQQRRDRNNRHGLKENGVNLAGIFEAFKQTQLVSLKDAVEMKDRGLLREAYRDSILMCNTCHQSTGRPFISITIPTNPPVSNQRWDQPPGG